MATNAGRPREYRNAAEKQKAYRERKKELSIREKALTQISAWFAEQEEALRNSITRQRAAGKTVHLIGVQLPHVCYGKILVGGYHHRHIEHAVWMYLTETGAVIETGKRSGERCYEFTDEER